MTPDEAVEAAAKVLRARFNGQREDKPWSSADQMRIYVGDARAALEAAAPHLMAQALNDAATQLAQLPYVRPDAEGREEYERLLAVRRGNTDAWLRARADSLKETA